MGKKTEMCWEASRVESYKIAKVLNSLIPVTEIGKIAKFSASLQLLSIFRSDNQCLANALPMTSINLVPRVLVYSRLFG